ncbi:MAG: asparagine synthetase B [Vicinamibacterales bacterium]
MSGLAAFVARDGRPADHADLAPLEAGIARRGPDGTASWMDGPVGLAHAAFVTSPHDGPQPVVDRDAGLAIVLDGHLHERAALGAALGMGAAAAAAASDAALCLAAYRRWGEDAFARLSGEFALAIWDGGSRRLVCARDPMGGRPLYYAVDAGCVRVASTLAALVSACGPGPNEGMVGEWLCGYPVHPSDTLYAGVERLPPGHLLVADPRHHRVTRFWAPDGFRELRYGTASEYDEHFRALFDAVVADHLRVAAGQPPPALMLSGGLDSGSILASAAAQGAGLPCFTIGYDDPALDESPLAEGVLRHVGATDWERVAPSIDELDPDAEARETGDVPTYPSGAASLGLRIRARHRGARVMLTGVGGDEWFYGSDWRGADFLSRGDLAGFVRHWRASLAMPDSIGTVGVWRNAVWPLVPPRLRNVARVLVKGRGAVPPWIDPAWARRIGLAGRLRLDQPPVPARSHAVRDHILSGWGGLAAVGHDEQERFAARAGLEDRQPFMDRRIVEFALSLPEAERWRAGWPKAIMRRAFRDRLPAATLERRDQPDYASLTVAALERVRWRSRLGASGLVARGWLDGAGLRALTARADRHPAGLPDELMDKIWSLVAMDAWHEAAAAGPPPGYGRR